MTTDPTGPAQPRLRVTAPSIKAHKVFYYNLQLTYWFKNVCFDILGGDNAGSSNNVEIFNGTIWKLFKPGISFRKKFMTWFEKS